MANANGGGATARLTKRGAATRHRIVSAAADLMYTSGVAGTSLADVMAASGTGASQMYHYFTDKDALVSEVVALQVERTLSTQERLLARVDSRRALRRWRDAEVLEARSRTYGCVLGSLAGELSCRSQSSRRSLAHAFSTWEDHLCAALLRIQAQGEISVDADPAILAVGLLSALQGGLLLAQTTSDPKRLEIALDAALAALPA